jgi:hypothetical protein
MTNPNPLVGKPKNVRASTYFDDNVGGFNRSMQHLVEVYLQDFERLNSLANVDSKKRSPV